MASVPQVTVEFFGMARHHAGRAELQVNAATLADALTAVAHTCPQLAPLIDGQRLSSQFLASVNAGPFLTNLDTRLTAGDRILLLSADAGG